MGYWFCLRNPAFLYGIYMVTRLKTPLNSDSMNVRLGRCILLWYFCFSFPKGLPTGKNTTTELFPLTLISVPEIKIYRPEKEIYALSSEIRNIYRFEYN